MLQVAAYTPGKEKRPAYAEALEFQRENCPTPPLLESPSLADLSDLGCAGKSTEGLKAIDQIPARRRLAPMNELTEAAKRTVAR
jgi:hypothetical protein